MKVLCKMQIPNRSYLLYKQLFRKKSCRCELICLIVKNHSLVPVLQDSLGVCMSLKTILILIALPFTLKCLNGHPTLESFMAGRRLSAEYSCKFTCTKILFLLKLFLLRISNLSLLQQCYIYWKTMWNVHNVKLFLIPWLCSREQ